MHADEIRAALERLIRDNREDYAHLSQLLGRNPAYVQQYLKRGTPRILSEDDRKRLARYFGISGEVLGLDPGAEQTAGETGLIPIPQYNIRASAGHGAYTGEETGVINFAFSPQWLESTGGSRARDLSIIRVKGDSMFPTLADGDDIMVDSSAALGKLRDGIYVMRSDDTLVVKRVAVHPSQSTLTISSDNPAYGSWPDCSPDDVQIIGRVVWAGRKFH